jgi:hypothetical protein
MMKTPAISPYWLSPITRFHHIGDNRYYRDILESVTSLSRRAQGPCRGTRWNRALSWAMPWVLERINFISTRVNHMMIVLLLFLQKQSLAFAILRATKPNTKRDNDDTPFIVLTETKFSFRCIPVWDRYSPYRTRV